MSITICIDYDNTYTSDVDAWNEIIGILTKRGHRVICITSRFPQVPLGTFPGEVFYAAGEPKRSFANRMGMKVDIWVDDSPESICDIKFHGSPQSQQRDEIMQQLWTQVRNQWPTG